MPHFVNNISLIQLDQSIKIKIKCIFHERMLKEDRNIEQGTSSLSHYTVIKNCNLHRPDET